MRSLRVLAVAAALLVLLAMSLQAAPVQQARSQFGWIVASRLTVNNAASVGGDLTAAGDAEVAGDTALTGALQVGGFLGTTPQDTVTVVMTGNITPTSSYIPLTAAGAVGTSAIVTTSLVAGQILNFVNVGSQTITISDTGILKLSGNAALAADDTLTLLYDGTNLRELAQGDN